MKRKNQIYEMTLLAILSGLIILMSFTPIGYIKTAGLEITLLVIPVVIGGICLGPKGGLFLGTLFGITSFLQCVLGLSAFGAVLFTINPWLDAVVCIIPRALMGFLVGVIFKALNGRIKPDILSHIIASISGALLNTIFFMSLLCICFYNTEYLQGFKEMLGAQNVFTFIILFVGINGLIELILNFIVGAAVTKTLFVVSNKFKK